MTDFDPRRVFHSFYRTRCLRALDHVMPRGKYAQYRCDEIEHHLESMLPELEKSQMCSSHFHFKNLEDQGGSLSMLKTNQVCLLCHFRAPERVLSCGHSICDICVRRFGRGISGYEDRYALEWCAFCRGPAKLTVDLKPKTAGVRIIAIAGGGCRGRGPLEFLRLLQQLLGGCPLHQMFDFSAGTSSGSWVAPICLKLILTQSGGLSNFCVFALHWEMSHCDEIFENLAQRCFGGTHRSPWGRVKAGLRWLSYDALYDEKVLEECLQKVFGLTRRLFDHINDRVSGTRIAVSAMMDRHTPSIITNYNGCDKGQRKGALYHAQPWYQYLTKILDYTLIRPKNIEDELFIWEAWVV